MGFACIFLLVFSSCHAMLVSKSVNLMPGNEIPLSQYIARFAVPYEASMLAKVRVKLETPFNEGLRFPLEVLFFDDDEWNQVLASGSCMEARALARYKLPQFLQSDGEWSDWIAYTVQRVAKNQVWYVVLSDCSGGTHNSYLKLPSIDVELHMLNSGSEFSHEEYGILTMNVILLIIYIYFLATTTYNVVLNALRNDEMDNPIMACVMAIYMELLHIGAQTIHLVLYSQNGKGFFLLDFASTILQMNAQIVMVLLLIMIAFGWEITDIDFTKENKYFIIGGFICVIHTGMAFLSCLDDGEHHKYHDFGGFQGFMLVVIRIALYITFIYGITTTIKQVPKKTKSFLKALSVAGTLYMLTFPTLWVFSYIITAHLRNRLIVYGNLGMQLFALIILLNQLSKKGTRFTEASNKSKEIIHGKTF